MNHISIIYIFSFRIYAVDNNEIAYEDISVYDVMYHPVIMIMNKNMIKDNIKFLLFSKDNITLIQLYY